MNDGTSSLIFDWNTSEAAGGESPFPSVELDDETLRDGLQSPSVRHPPVVDRIRLLRLMGELGIDAADIGMPASGEWARRVTLALATVAAEQRIPVRLNCAARTLTADIKPIAEIAQRAGVPIEVMAFVGSSPIRLYTEGWDAGRLQAAIRAATRFATREGLEICLVTEDTTRARPELLRSLYRAALDEGATRLCLTDTVGHATPAAVRRLAEFASTEILQAAGRPEVPLDWHGHNDRGLGLANALAAIDAGFTRVHGTALGIGERCGNSAMDQILLNLSLLGCNRDIARLPEYCRHASAIFDRPIPRDYPVVGQDAFRTASGVHASAIAKAVGSGHGRLADLVYSSVPASAFGLAQRIEIGPASGRANVEHWLRAQGLPCDAPLTELILKSARSAPRVLTDGQVTALVEESGHQIGRRAGQCTG